jgi:hypothetical protein
MWATLYCPAWKPVDRIVDCDHTKKTHRKFEYVAGYAMHACTERSLGEARPVWSLVTANFCLPLSESEVSTAASSHNRTHWTRGNLPVNSVHVWPN